jgi:ArsR family transcriptional regulator, virulence genes transcriptional regulator
MNDGPIPDEAIRQMTQVFHLAANPSKLRILCLLAERERGVTSMLEELKTTRAAFSQSIALLKASGLIAGRREGKQVFYKLASKGEAVMAFARSLASLPGGVLRPVTIEW